jgi:N,N'-diacetyllegionaminate synthase
MMTVLGVILARAGSKGLPDKCVRPLLGRPVIDYTFDHVKASRRLTASVLTTDSEPAKDIARRRGIEVIDRPAELAIDTATVDAAARNAVEAWELEHHQGVDIIVLLYGNIPVRAEGLIDRAVEHLHRTGADSVRSVAPVAKQHPDWVHRLDGDRMTQFRVNSIYRRQDLEPLFYHNGAVAAMTRRALFGALKTPNDFQSFLGGDRRAIVCDPEDAVDIDGPMDLAVAEAILRTGTESHRHVVTKGTSTIKICPICIANHSIGPDAPVFVVAEAGVNHNGDVSTALRMVDVAADAGADAIKFQLFRAMELTSREAPTAEYQRQATQHSTQQAMLAQLELDDDAFKVIVRRCQERSIIFLGTPFGPRDVSRLVKLGAPGIKLSSSDLNNVVLLEATAATALPLILSTGASTANEIEEAVRLLERLGARERLILLHCVSAYPAPIEAINLAAVGTLHSEFKVPTGFSDHTTSTHTGTWAVLAGACVIEKHFTLDRALTGPDHAMSLPPDELKIYIGGIRQAQRARGTGKLGYGNQEREVREAARRSVVSEQEIRNGTRITRSMLALKRPGTGIAPRELESIIGKIAATDIPGDTLLSWNMVR